MLRSKPLIYRWGDFSHSLTKTSKTFWTILIQIITKCKKNVEGVCEKVLHHIFNFQAEQASQPIWQSVFFRPASRSSFPVSFFEFSFWQKIQSQVIDLNFLKLVRSKIFQPAVSYFIFLSCKLKPTFPHINGCEDEGFPPGKLFFCFPLATLFQEGCWD